MYKAQLVKVNRQKKLNLRTNLHRRLKRGQLKYCLIHRIIYIPYPKKLKASTREAISLLGKKFEYKVRVYGANSIPTANTICCKQSIGI